MRKTALAHAIHLFKAGLSPALVCARLNTLGYDVDLDKVVGLRKQARYLGYLPKKKGGNVGMIR